MNPPGYSIPPSQRPPPRHILSIVQQPERAKVVLRGKEKDRKPIDPPPIVQLFREGEHAGGQSLYFHNPYYICLVTLWHPERDEPKLNESNNGGTLTPLMGNCSASLNKLKDLHNADGAYFVFSDISASVQGPARLKFTLQEMKPQENRTICLTEEISEVFEVMTAKDFDGPKESTPLSRSFADQGVKLRLRKESRSSANKRMFVPQPGSGGPNTPIRPLPSGAASYGSHSSSAEDGEPAAKRHRSSTLSMTYSSLPAHAHQAPHSAYGAVPGGSSYPPPYGGYQYGQQSQPYSQYPYRSQAPSENSTFMSPFTSPNGQPQSQYGGQQSAYGGYGSAYPYSSVAPSSSYPAPYPSQQQATGAQYGSDPYRSSMYGSNAAASSSGGRSLGNPESTPRLPPIQSSQGGATGHGDGAQAPVKDEPNPYGTHRA